MPTENRKAYIKKLAKIAIMYGKPNRTEAQNRKIKFFIGEVVEYEKTLPSPRAYTVDDLIIFLKAFPKDMELTYHLYSESCLMDISDIDLNTGCWARNDGWIQNQRPDMASKNYLCFPGN